MNNKGANIPLQLGGIHHLTAVTANVRENVKFYTETLGLRLVKKTVNQDDVSAYHLFYADGKGSPGTDMTFFDWPAAREKRGTQGIVRTMFRVANSESLRFWEDRLDTLAVDSMPIVERGGRETLEFEDSEGQRLALVVGEGRNLGEPWPSGPVPVEHQLQGLGPIVISVPELDSTEAILTGVMNMRKVSDYISRSSDGGPKDTTYHVFEMGNGGPSSELHVGVEPHLGVTRHGAGGVHHVAFRVATFDEYDQWATRLREKGVASSGPVDRFYFRSLYFREPNGILFELATDGPGFATDESLETMGEKLALPPFLEGRRSEIEARLKPLS